MQNPLESCQGPSGFLFIIAFGFLFLIMFNRDLGDSISETIGLVLFPLIGFGGHYPLLTMFCSGILTVGISTGIRHFMIDWVDMAKKQKTMNEYNKAIREATKSGNQSRVEKLQSENQDIMQLQSGMMMNQMKSSILSMVIVILIFRWLYSYIWSLPQATISTPWDLTWPLTDSALSDLCGSICMNPSGGGIPYWIFAYILITIPIGQVLMRGLKYWEFSRKLKEQGQHVFGERLIKEEMEEVDEELDEYEKRIGKKRKKGPSTGRSKKGGEDGKNKSSHGGGGKTGDGRKDKGKKVGKGDR